MALFNYANREITAKIVYYGPGVCGKTTSLQYIHERIAPEQRGRLLSLATETDRTIFFDLLPLKLGEIGGFKLRFQLYTVPGQVKYNKTRKLVLQGADAVVFVADSQRNRRDSNIESFKNLQENLQEQKRRLEDVPIVFEYNKRDVPNPMSIEELNRDLNARNYPYFPAIATQGVGVMETLEAISKIALRDMEQRLQTGNSGTEPVGSQNQKNRENLLTESDDLLDLTNSDDLSGDTLDFSEEELNNLQLDADLDEEGIESQPIGYDHNIPVQEVEIIEETVAHTGTLKESDFFNLKDIEEQALRELDEFLDGNDEESFSLAFSDGERQETGEDVLGGEESFSTFTLDRTTDEEESADSFGEESSLLSEDENMLDFHVESNTSGKGMFERPAASSAQMLEFEDMSEGTMKKETKQAEEAELSFSLDEESAQEESLLNFTVDENEHDLFPGQDASVKGAIEPLDLSDSDLDLSFGDNETEGNGDLPAFKLDEEDVSGDSTLFSAEEEDLIAFTLDEDAELSGRKELGGLTTDTDSLELSFDQEELPASYGASPGDFHGQGFALSDTSEFRITDSVRFEMQVGEDISSGTPFEQQLEAMSSEMFTGEEDTRKDEFQPELSDAVEDEQFQTISDEWTRLIVLAKHVYHRGETYRGQHTVSENIIAVMLYYTAIETALKAVASKYETCNPTIASFHLLLESIEEETGKTIAGRKSLISNIVRIRDKIQLEAQYPDDEECELAARISERFLTELSKDFLTIDFTKLSPVLPRAEA